MKPIFKFKNKEFGYRIINGKVRNIRINDEMPEELLALVIDSAEYHDVSEEVKQELFDEKMKLSHNEYD